MLKIIKCPICGSKEISVLYNDAKDNHTDIKGEFSIWKCWKCGVFFLNPMRSNEELALFYDNNYYSFDDYIHSDLKGIIGRLKTVYRYIKDVRTYVPPLNKDAVILDVGCGSGRWLWMMKNKGYSRVYGCEVAEEAAKKGTEISGIKIYPGQLTASDFEEESFDYIRFNHSFEHINNPNETIEKAYSLLKGGASYKLVCQIPIVQ